MATSIKYKAALPVALLALAFVAFGGLSIYVLSRIENISEDLVERFHEIEKVRDIESTAGEIIFPHLYYLTVPDPATRQKVNEMFARLDGYSQDLHRMHVVNGEERELLAFTENKIQAAKFISSEIFQYTGGELQNSMRLIYDLSALALSPIHYKMIDWNQDEARQVRELSAAADKLLHRYLLGVFIFLLAVALLIAFTFWLNNSLLIKPVLSITYITAQLATGNFKEKTLVHSDDELGKLAQNINEMAQSLEKMYSKLNNLARIDQLTGVQNRLSMDEILRHELASATRYGEPFTLAIFDLDHFKHVNDRHGHMVGDKVLQHVAESCMNNIRNSDYCFRYGGEEFLLLFPRTPPGIAIDIIERFRKSIEADQAHIDSITVSITASFGVASYPVDCDNIDDLIVCADQAMYMAKNAGRNTTVTCSSLHDVAMNRGKTLDPDD